MKSKFAKFLDSIMLAGALWLFSALVLRYFINDFFIVLAVAAIITVGIFFLLRLRGKKSGEESFFAAKVVDFFLFKDDAFSQDYFFEAFKKRYHDAAVNTISPFNQGFIRIKDTLIFVCMGEALSVKRAVFLCTAAIREKAKTVVILCPSCEKNVALIKNKFSDIKLEIFTGEKIYKLLKSLNSVPQFTKTPYKTRMKEFFTAALMPERTKGYLFTSLTLLGGAYFSQFWLYFLVAGSVCLALALLCRFNILGRKA